MPFSPLLCALEKAGSSHQQAVALDSQEVPAESVHAKKVRAR